RTEHDAAHLCAGVLEREVAMTTRGAYEVGDLARHPQRAEIRLDQAGDAPVELRDGEDLAIARHRRGDLGEWRNGLHAQAGGGSAAGGIDTDDCMPSPRGSSVRPRPPSGSRPCPHG